MTWTIASIRQANEAAGFDFFGRDEAVGGGAGDFGVRVDDAGIWIVRLKPKRRPGGGTKGGVGDIRLFDPATGHIGSVQKGSRVVLDLPPKTAA